MRALSYGDTSLLRGHFAHGVWGDTSLGGHFIVMTLDYEDTSLVRLLVMGTYAGAEMFHKLISF